MKDFCCWLLALLSFSVALSSGVGSCSSAEKTPGGRVQTAAAEGTAFVLPLPQRTLSSQESGQSARLRGGGGRGGRSDRRLILARSAGESGGDGGFNLEEIFKSIVSWASGIVGSIFTLLGAKEAAERSTPQARGRSRSGRLVQRLGMPVDAATDAPVYSLGAFPKCTEASDLRRVDRHFTIVTTAALPWRTGPAINALLRALQLAQRGQHVVLVMPWVDRGCQENVFDDLSVTCETKEDQLQYIRNWIAKRTRFNLKKLPLELRFYDATYVEAVRSIFPSGDVTKDFGDGPRDVLILEEPEHLTWYHNGERWPDTFSHVVGLVHTNYQVYLEDLDYQGIMAAAAIRDTTFFTFTSLVCSAYCDVVIKLAEAGITLPNEVVYNCNGVRDEFFRIGTGKALRAAKKKRGSQEDAPQAYYIGKAVYKKGWRELLDFLEADGVNFQVDGFGSGPDFQAISERAAALAEKSGSSSLRMHKSVDHADDVTHKYKVLVNPSTTEVLSTVTGEALAMGKHVVLAEHPSNKFWQDNFADRCHFFKPRDVTSFRAAVEAALSVEERTPLTQKQAALLSWDSAVDRLFDASQVHVLSGQQCRPSEVESSRLAYRVHRSFQDDTKVISDFLKGATLNQESRLAPWRKDDSQGN
eukprot:TRINITY_DN28655_c0_g3_i2.p1 TRINITY_DN28655_c0_g3~~TRINITY_DN28655_c0_g3_i2.p1  ORF type:complete len:642 (+),score=163.65 TRINITY_DN28655_c0_g3_i2:90-2015(+)